MALPAAVTTATATWGKWGSLAGTDGTAVVTVAPYFGDSTQHIIWTATGESFTDTPWSASAAAGQVVTLTLPHVDQAGWKDPAGNAFTMWTYRVTAVVTIGSDTRTYYRNVQPLVGQSTIDLDLVPYAAVGAPSSAAVPAVTSVNGQTGAVTVAGGGATNLSTTRNGTTVTVASDTGTDAVLVAADGSNAGIMTSAQATTLAGAQPALASPDQAEAEAGTATTARSWTAQRDRQGAVAAIAATLPNTSTGRAVLNAADAAAARSALGIVPTPVRFSANVATIETTGTDEAYAARTITAAYMRTGTAPVGSNLVAVVQHSTDGSSWSTVTTLTITAGSTTKASQTGLSQAQSAGHLLRLNVTSVGSTTAATDVVVDVVTT